MRKGITPRSRWDIIYDILQETPEGRDGESKVKKTHIMQEAYLDWWNFQRHFDFLVKQGFIEHMEEDNCYYLTDKGRYLKYRLRDLKDMALKGNQNKLFVPELDKKF